jgi:hypothetical protein
MLGMAGLAWGKTVENYPKPMSESVEQTGPGQMVFMSYPKYYRDAARQLKPVNTTLVESTDPDWDYEVTTGIWSLFVRRDGTFQARHQGDVFTYRFDSLGIGRESGYQPLDLGQANFAEMTVSGDTVTWQNVVEGVDLKVRYIHDILKVDVKIKKETMGRIRTSFNRVEFPADTYLTARFGIPSVLISSQPKQGRENADLYAERLDLGANPLYFEKNGKTIHKLRPVETYILDAHGQPIEFWNNDPKPGNEISIHCAQVWQLKPNQPGLAEMSARLDDLVNLPDGDVVIDPFFVFEGEGFYSSGDIIDSYINQSLPSNYYGTDTSLYVGSSSPNEKRILLGISHVRSEMGQGCKINSASVELTYKTRGNSESTIKGYAVTKDWYCSTVTWNDSGFNNPPSTSWSGGLYDSTCHGPDTTLTTNTNITKAQIDVTNVFNTFYYDPSDLSLLVDRGFLIKLTGGTSNLWSFYAAETSIVTNRPKVIVNYALTTFGADIGYVWDPSEGGTIGSRSDRFNKLNENGMKVIRYFIDGPALSTRKQYLSIMAESAKVNGNKIIAVMSMAGWGYYTSAGSATNYAAMVEDILTSTSPDYEVLEYIQDGTIIGVELGNEEDEIHQDINLNWYHNFDPSLAVSTQNYFSCGQKYAEYYVLARNAIRDNIPISQCPNFLIYAPAISKHDTLSLGDDALYPGVGQSAKAFLCGFLSKVANNYGGVNKLPDVISIHGYDKVRPECSKDSILGASEWYHRLDTLKSICDNYNYHPKFAITEYGYSPVDGKSWAVENADELTQSIYYMRRALMDATVVTSDKNSWLTSLYWQHAFNDDDNNPSTFTGWFSSAAPNFTNRVIRKVGAHFHQPDQFSIGIGDIQKIWMPFTSVIKLQNIYTAKCGWIKSDNIRWAAVWVFNLDFTRFWDVSDDSYDFLLTDANAPQSVEVYKLVSGSSPPSYNNTDWVLVETVNRVLVSGTTYKYTLTHVDENPSFIKFGNF